MQRRWEVQSACPVDFVEQAGFLPYQAQLLWNRGLRSKEEMDRFLTPSWDEHLHDPGQFRHLIQATDLIFSALEQRKRITVHGDYDADGVTGSTLLITVLRELERQVNPGATMVDYYIPHREKEGYGLHKNTVGILKERGTELVITVDCGIACVDEIALAHGEKIKTIVVDHHQFGERLPMGALIHPGLPEETYPFKSLAAVGVSFKFACALFNIARQKGFSIPAGWEKWLLDLVAIATVTDVVPLIGENRVLEAYGLKVLNKTKRPGLRALIERAGLEFGKLDTESIGFGIGPRINAAGRMEHASLALELLLAETEAEAARLADELEACNKQRQEATKLMMKQADELLIDRYGDDPTRYPNVLTLWDDRWSPSLVGLAAGRYMERFSKPVLAIGFHSGAWIGSGRSLPVFDVTDAVRVAGEGLLTRFGGHVQACGFALTERDHIPVFADRLEALSRERLTPEQLVPKLTVDVELPLHEVTWNAYEFVQRMQPFGEGNRQPMFLSRRCAVIASQTVGQSQAHLRLQIVTKDGVRLNAIGFKLGDLLSQCAYGSLVDIVYHIDVNEWQGRKELQLKMVDVRKSE